MADKGKVLVIGASGMVGAETADMLQKYAGVEVFNFSEPVITESDIKRRDDRANQLHILRLKTETLDHQQAEWLLGDRKELPQNERLDYQRVVTSIQDALANDIDTIVISAGKPRAAGEDRSALMKKNANMMIRYGNEIADAFFAQLQKNPEARFPVIINAGNPMDAMTETVGKTISARLARLKKDNPQFADKIQATIDELPAKVIGQGGILDEARATFAISELTGIPREDIRCAPVLGTHNEKMVIDFDAVLVRVGERGVPLKDYPGIQLTDALKSQITQKTRAGGSDVLKDTTEKTGIAQTAVFGTAAAILKMVEASLSQNRTPPVIAAVYDPELNAVIGQRVLLGRDGAKPSPAAPEVAGLEEASAGAQKDSQTVLETIRMAAAAKIKTAPSV